MFSVNISFEIANNYPKKKNPHDSAYFVPKTHFVTVWPVMLFGTDGKNNNNNILGI